MGPVPQPEEDRDRPGHNNTEEIEDAEYPDVIINADTDSDDDDDDDNDGQDGYGGYQALSQNVDVDKSDSTDSESDQEPPFEAFQQYEYENTDDTVDDNDISRVGEPAMDVQEPASGVRVPDGLLHQVRQPDYPNVENLPNYMQVPEVPRPEKKELLWNQPRNSDHMLDIGTNGGISVAGTLASILGGVLVGLAYYFTLILLVNEDYLSSSPPQWPLIPIGGLLGLVGSLVDSFLGATLQYSGYDKKKQCVVNEPGPMVEHISGSNVLDNHSVNLLSSLITALVAPRISFHVFVYILSH